MDIITIDFETYYDNDYSLRKLTTEEYVRSELFEIIGVAIKVNADPATWYSGKDPRGFVTSLDYTDAAILCHNTVFDGAILSWHMGVRPKLWLDTLSIARYAVGLVSPLSLDALSKKYGLPPKGDEVTRTVGMRRADFNVEQLSAFADYAVNDAEVTYALWQNLKHILPPDELRIIDQLIRMYTEPQLEIDRQMLADHLEQVRAGKATLMQRIGDSPEVRKAIMSNNQLADLLRKLGVEPPTKVSPRTGKTTWAFAKTDKAFTDLQETGSPAVQAVVAARLGVKSTLEETRTEALIQVADRGTLPVMLKYYGAHSGRLSGGDGLNLQNLPSRGGQNTIKRALKAPEGYVLVAGDSSQVEARITAYEAGQEDLVQAFREGRDVYCEFAGTVYNREVTKADKLERFVGKTGILSLGYGSGAGTFQSMLRVQGGVHMEIDPCSSVVRAYRNRYSMVPAMWRTLDNVLERIARRESGVITPRLSYDPEGIRLPNGLYLRYMLLNRGPDGMRFSRDNRAWQAIVAAKMHGRTPGDRHWQSIWGGFALENISQALASLLIREQMLRIGAVYRVLLQVHDEIVALVPEKHAEEATEFVRAVMSTPPTWAPDLPIACEVGAAGRYGDIVKH